MSLRLAAGSLALLVLAGCAHAAAPTVGTNAVDAAFEAQGVSAELSQAVADADRSAFDGYDADHDGRLTPAEVPFLAPSRLAEFDKDRDGALSYAEAQPPKSMIAGVARLLGKSLASYFKKRDADHDGRLSGTEAPDLVTSRGTVAPAGLLDAFAAADAVLEAAPIRAAAKKPPVEMIPGFVMPIHTFYPIRKALHEAGYADTTIMNQWPWFGRIEEYAAIARMHVDAAKKRTGANKVEVLGHSMGGLTARTLVKSFGGDKDVSHVVTYGTPHHGTVLGTLVGWALPSCHEMSLGSDFLKALNQGDETPGDIRYTSIHCSWDEIVVPARSVDLAGAENLNVKNTFHIEMLFDPTTTRLTLEALAK